MTVRITWYGHATFGLEAAGTQVLIDPFFTGNPACPDRVNIGDLNPVVILITHGHNDHIGDTVALAKRTGAKVIGMVELVGFLGKKGVENTVGANFGGTVAFDGGSVKLVPAWHTSSYNDDDGTVVPLGIPAGLIVNFGGKTIYFAGDTCLFGDMALIGEEGLDVAVLPIGDHFTMGPKDAVRAARLLNAGTVIPCHYNTFPPIRQDADQWAADVKANTSSMALVLQPGESTQL
jgi:L-ascorbate metabolism protein UlaG (beta-lactamase superfamily)